MQSNTRFYAIVVAVIVALAAFWLLIRGGEGPKVDQAAKPAETASKPVDRAPRDEAAPERPAPTKRESSEPLGELASTKPDTSATVVSGDGSLTGIAKDSSGEPIAGATVRILAMGWKSYEKRPADAKTIDTTTDNDGKFSIEKLPLKTSIGLIAELGPLFAVESVYIGERTKTAEVELTLMPTAFVAGTVVNSDDEPVAGASLYAARWKEQGENDDLPFVETEITGQVTDEAGAFRFPHVPMGSFKFLVKSDAYASLLSDWVVSGTENAKFVLRPGGSIAGRVIYKETGKPASKVNVIARTDTSREEQRQESGPDGAFSFSNLRDTDISLNIDSETLTLTREPERIKLASQQNVDGIEIEIDKGGIVSGFVRDAATNKGVRNARLQLYTESRGGGILRTSKDATTDDDGSYTIAGLPAGSYTIYVSQAEGYVSEDYNKRQVISVATGQSLDDIDFTLERGGSLAGRVIDEAGDPVPQARVSVALKRGGRWASAESDVNGLFTVLGVAAEPEVFVRAEKKGLVSAPAGPFDMTGGAVDDVTITMLKEATISGVVVDESGKPVPRAQVIPYPVEEKRTGFGSPIERANENGEFKLERLAEGEYQLQATINDGGWTRNPNKEKIRVAAGEEKTGVRIVFEGAGGLSIAGRVTGEDGKPVTDANIWVSGPNSHASAQTDSDGRYKVAGLKEGNFYVNVSANGYSRGDLRDIPAGSENADIVLKGTGRIEGSILDAVTKKPVTDFEILYAANAGMSMQSFRHMGPGARTRSEDGSFHIENAEAGVAGLLVKGQGYAPKLFQVTDIVPGETKSGIIIEVEPGGIVEGVVRDSSGNPVQGAQVYDTPVPLADYMRERSVRATTAADGAFRLDGLPNGNVTISAYHANYAGANVQVNVAPGKTTQADIVLGTGGTVRIRVTENGVPTTGAYAGIQEKIASDSNALEPDSNGIVEFKSVPAGDYRAYCGLRTGDGMMPGRNQGREISVSEGQVTEVAFDFAAGTASVAGTVAFDGQPPSRAWVRAKITGGAGAGEESRHAQADANGQFTIDNLPAGQAILNVSGSMDETNMVSRQVTVNLVDGKTTDVAVELSGGGTVSGAVAVMPAGGHVNVSLARGTLSVPARATQEDFIRFHQDDLVVAGAVADPATGAFTINGVEPGQYTVIAAHDGVDPAGVFHTASASVTVSEGETSTVALAFP